MQLSLLDDVVTIWYCCGMPAEPRIALVESWVAGVAHIVRVTDDTGRYGIGQSSCWAYPESVDSVVQRFGPLLIGRDPRRIEETWHLLFRHAPFRGSVISGAVAAIDIALWDLRAKSLGVPLFDLLGGKATERLRLHQLILGWRDLDDLAGQIELAVSAGFTAVKVDPVPPGPPSGSLHEFHTAIATNAAAAREAAGPGVDVIIELHRRLEPWSAPAVISALAPLDPLFVEDAIQIDSIADQASLTAASPVLLGHGERLHSIWEVRELLDAGGPQAIRCDVALAGGISHARKIVAVAEAFGAPLAWHCFNGPVVTAATAHLECTSTDVLTHEWFAPLDEPGAVPGFQTGLRRDGGWLVVGDDVGLGVDVDPRLLEPVSFET